MKSNCNDPDHCLPFSLPLGHGIIEQIALVKVQTCADKGNISVKWAIA